MLPRGRGSIFFTGATASLRGGPGFAAFASAKFGLRAVAQSMARELGPKGIHVAHLVIDSGVDTAWVRERRAGRLAAPEEELFSGRFWAGRRAVALGLADRLGAEICGDPRWLASGLQKLEHYKQGIVNPTAEAHPASAHMFIVNPLSGLRMDALFSTHPPMEQRVARLRQQAGAIQYR